MPKQENTFESSPKLTPEERAAWIHTFATAMSHLYDGSFIMPENARDLADMAILGMREFLSDTGPRLEEKKRALDEATEQMRAIQSLSVNQPPLILAKN
jgi:hypothetical protein